jgi:hypothetical protein
MSAHPSSGEAAFMERIRGRRYRIVLRGELGDQFQARFGGMALERANGLTVLTGNVLDQAQLIGFIERGQELGVELVSVEPLDDPEDEEGDDLREEDQASGSVGMQERDEVRRKGSVR